MSNHNYIYTEKVLNYTTTIGSLKTALNAKQNSFIQGPNLHVKSIQIQYSKLSITSLH